MIYSNIPTHNFTKRQLKKIAGLSLKFCMDKFGVNNKKWYPLGLTIVHDMNDGYFDASSISLRLYGVDKASFLPMSESGKV